MRTLHIIASQLTESVDEQDTDVAGRYYCQVPNDIDDKTACSAAFDAFHETVAVHVLDDFEFTVFDPTSQEFLEEAEDTEGYTNSGIAKFVEKIGDIEKVPSNCYNCDNEATHVIKNVHGNGRGFHTPICETCKTAYENGQASPHATFIEVEEFAESI